MKTRYIYWLLAGVFLTLIVSACGGQGESGQGSEQTYEFQVNSTSPEQDIQSLTLKHFGDRVTELSEGRIEFQYFWGGSLVPVDQTFQGVRDGLADISTMAMSYASGDVPDVAVLEVPFAWPIDAENMTAFHEEVNPTIDELMQENGQKLLMSNPAIMGDAFSCRDGFLASEEDWAGTLTRTAGRWQGETIEAWGGRPVVIPLGDLYSALERGTADCTLLVYNLVDSFRLYEVAPYITRTDHSIQYTTFNMNLNSWNQLSEEDKQIFEQAAEESWDYGLQLRDDRQEEILQNLVDSGAELCTPPDEELSRLRGASESVLDQIRQEVSPRGQELIDIAQGYRDVVTERPAYGPNNPCS